MAISELGRAFVARYTEPDERTAARQLAALLEDPPEALAIADAFLREVGAPPQEYLGRWILLEEQTLRNGGYREGYPAQLCATLSLRHMAAEGDPAIFLLLLLSFFSSDDISTEVLDAWRLPEGAPRIEILTEPEVIKGAAEKLIRWRLLDRAEEGLRFPHPLVQVAAQRQVGMAEREKITSLLLYRMLDIFEFDARDESSWVRTARLIPHVLSIVEHHERLGGQSEIAATLLMQAGGYFLVRENLARAKDCFLRAVPRAEGLSEVVGRSFLGLLSHLAELFDRRGEPSDAEDAYNGVVRLSTLCLPKNDPERGELLRKRGAFYRKLGRLDDARRDLRAAIALDEEIRGESVEAAQGYYALALVEIEAGHREEAGRHLESTLSLFEALAPEPAPPEWISAAGLAAGFFAERGELLRARAYYEQAIRLLTILQDAKFFVLAVLWAGLAAVLDELGEAEAARDACRRALAIYEGDPERDTELPRALLMNRLGLLLEGLGEAEAALENMSAAHEILRRRLGADHPDTRTVQQNLALLFQGPPREEPENT